MKKTYVLLISVIFAALIFLQFSCAALQEQRVEEEPVAEVEEEPQGPVLLEDTHKAAGIECSDCHEETPAQDAVSKESCLTCHADYKEQAASYLDPHNAHITYSDCGDCHHVHRESEMICQGCHNFNVQAP